MRMGNPISNSFYSYAKKKSLMQARSELESKLEIDKIRVTVRFTVRARVRIRIRVNVMVKVRVRVRVMGGVRVQCNYIHRGVHAIRIRVRV